MNLLRIKMHWAQNLYISLYPCVYGWALMLIILMGLENKPHCNSKDCRKCTRTRSRSNAHGAYRLFDVFRLFVRTMIVVVVFFSLLFNIDRFTCNSIEFLNRKWSVQRLTCSQMDVCNVHLLLHLSNTVSIMKWKWWARNENRKLQKN